MKLCVLFQISTILRHQFSEKVPFQQNNVFNTFVFCDLSSHFLKTETIHLTFLRSKQLINLNTVGERDFELIHNKNNTKIRTSSSSSFFPFIHNTPYSLPVWSLQASNPLFLQPLIPPSPISTSNQPINHP